MHEDFTHSGAPGRMQDTAVAQGGFLLACTVDAAMTVAAGEAELPESAVAVTEAKITFLAPGRIGELECKVMLRQMGGRVGFADVVAMQGGKVLLTSSVTMELTRKPFTNAPSFLPSLPGIPRPPTARMSPESQSILETDPYTSPAFKLDSLFFRSDWWFFDLERCRSWTDYSPAASLADGQENVQEGFLAAMMDNAMGMLYGACKKWENALAPTLELQARFFRPVRHGMKIQGFSRLLHMSPQIAHVETEFFQDGERCAAGTSSILMTYKPMPKL